MTIVNIRIPARDLRVGDTFIVTHAPDSPNRYSVVAQVREIVWDGTDVIVFYGACDDPSGLAYGSDVTLRRGDKVTKVVAA